MMGCVEAGIGVSSGKYARRRQDGLIACRETHSTYRVRDEITDDTRSHRLPGAKI